MLSGIFNKVKVMVMDKKTLEEIQAAKPTADFDSEYKGFVTGEKLTEFIFKELTAKN
jgi:hypothetical protein